MMNLAYRLFVALFPFVSLGYFYGLFRNWSLNGSLYPLIALVAIMAVKTALGQEIVMPFYQRRKAFLTMLVVFLLVTSISTIVMSIYIDWSFNSSGYEVFKQPIVNAVKVLPRNIIVFFSFVVMFVMVGTLADVTSTIRLLYASFTLVLIYGYVQVFAIFNIDLFQTVYNFVWPLIDSGWAGEERSVPYIFGIPPRINITMPEASEVSHYFQSAIYPFLLGSIVSDFSVFRRRLGGRPLEWVIFAASCPLLFFTVSSSGYFIFFMQMGLVLLLYLKYRGLTRGVVRFLTGFTVMAGIVGALVVTKYYDELSQIDLAVIDKVFSVENGSSNTRYALSLAGLGVFLKFPLFGAGPANTNFFMSLFIPGWAADNYEITNAIATQAIPTLNYWVELLATAGVVGAGIYLYLLYRTMRPFARLGQATAYDVYLKTSFYIYLLSSFAHGFNSSSMSFIYMWAIWAFYICMITIQQRFDKADF